MKWNFSAGLKQLKIAKRKVELKEKKHKNVKLKEHILVHILAWYVLPLVFYKMPDQGSSWSYLCTKAYNNLHVSSKFKVAARLVPPNNPINARALSLGPRLRRRRQRQRQKTIGFMTQKNSPARASRFLVHFFDVQCTTKTWNLPMRRFMEDVDIRRQMFLSLFEHG